MIHRIAGLLLLSFGLSVPAHAANQPPTISGTPDSWVYVGAPYSFKPTGRDPEGARLTYQIYNKPAWAAFSTSTGALTGTPSTVGLWTGIRLRVSDGTNTSSAIYFFSIRSTSRDNGAPVISGSPATSVAPGTRTASHRRRATRTATRCASPLRIVPAGRRSIRRPASCPVRRARRAPAPTPTS